MEVTAYQYKAFGLTIGSDIPLPPLPPTAPAPADIIVKRGVLAIREDWLPTKAHRAGLNARVAQPDADTLLLNWSPGLTFAAVGGRELIVDTTHTDESFVALFTLSEALGLLLFQRGYFLLHGSAIRIHDKGVVFVGEPGAGKSTTVAAFAQKGFGVLSDDLVGIRFTDAGRPMLIPAFSQVKIWESSVAGLQIQTDELTAVREGVNKFSWHDSLAFLEEAVPLDRIYVLTDPNYPKFATEQLPTSQVPTALLGYFPLPDALLTGPALRTFFEQSVGIARSVPVFSLSRPADYASLYAFVEHLSATGS